MPDINQNEKALQNAVVQALVSAVGKATDIGRYTTSGKSKEYALKQYADNIQILGQSARSIRVGEEAAVNKWSLVTPRLTIDAKIKNDVPTMVNLIDVGLSKILKDGKLGGLLVSDLISVDGLTVSIPQMTIKGTDISSAINKGLATKDQIATKITSKPSQVPLKNIVRSDSMVKPIARPVQQNDRTSQVPLKNIVRSDSMVKPIARPVQQNDKTTIKQEKTKVDVKTQVNAEHSANASADTPRHAGAKIVKPIRGGGGKNWADKVSASRQGDSKGNAR